MRLECGRESVWQHHFQGLWLLGCVSLVTGQAGLVGDGGPPTTVLHPISGCSINQISVRINILTL